MENGYNQEGFYKDGAFDEKAEIEKIIRRDDFEQAKTSTRPWRTATDTKESAAASQWMTSCWQAVTFSLWDSTRAYVFGSLWKVSGNG